jgi:hypothetical protein
LGSRISKHNKCSQGVLGLGRTAEALDMPTGTQIIRSIELITYFIQLTCEIKFGIFILDKQRASLFLKREARYFSTIQYPFITKTCKIEAIEKMDKLKHN